MEAVVRLPVRDTSFGFLKPARSNLLSTIEFRYIGLDIQKRGTINYVHILYVKHAAINSVKLDNGKSDRVGSSWRAGRKESPGLRIHERYHTEFVSLAPVEVIEQDNVRETVEIRQALAEVLE
jgi:hypothetical protein